MPVRASEESCHEGRQAFTTLIIRCLYICIINGNIRKLDAKFMEARAH